MYTPTYPVTPLLSHQLACDLFFISVHYCCWFPATTSPTEHYGFITKLGTDTIAVESVTRQGNTVTSDEVDRFPCVRVRHTVINLNPDGSIRHLVMDIHTPSEPANERERKVTADVTNRYSAHLQNR